MPCPPDAREFFQRLGIGRRILRWLDSKWSQIESGDYVGLYNCFTIQQGRKHRRIEAPCPNLKVLQRVLAFQFYGKMRPSNAAHGFIRKRSPKTNAQAHLPNAGKPVLMVDIKDFFPSIDTAKVWRVTDRVVKRRFKNTYLGITPPGEAPERVLNRNVIAETITAICTKDGRLPMGSPASPYISNLFMAWFDHQLQEYCRKWQLTYTRYADDIAISGDDANRALRKVRSLVERVGLRLNDRKTRIRRRHRAQEVTGIVINSGKLTISRKQRRRIRAQTHHTSLHHEKAFTPLCDDPRPTDLKVLQGRAAWCAWVQPEHADLVTNVAKVTQLAAES